MRHLCLITSMCVGQVHTPFVLRNCSKHPRPPHTPCRWCPPQSHCHLWPGSVGTIWSVSEPAHSYTSYEALIRVFITCARVASGSWGSGGRMGLPRHRRRHNGTHSATCEAIWRCLSFSRSRSARRGSLFAYAATVMPVGLGAACCGGAGAGRFEGAWATAVGAGRLLWSIAALSPPCRQGRCPMMRVRVRAHLYLWRQKRIVMILEKQSQQILSSLRLDQGAVSTLRRRVGIRQNPGIFGCAVNIMTAEFRPNLRALDTPQHPFPGPTHHGATAERLAPHGRRGAAV